MRPFVFENPPLMQTEEGRVLGEYLARQLLSLQQSLDENYRASRSGHAGIFLSTPSGIISAPVSTTPVKIGAYDSKQPGENGATANIANGTLAVSEQGMWALGFQIQWDVSWTDSNDTVDVLFQYYDETDAVAVGPISSAVIPRYGTVLAATGLILTDLPPDKVNNEIALYVNTLVGSPDFTVTGINVMDFYVFRVSNFQFGV